MSIFELTGAESCKKCGERARAERDRLQNENAKLRKLIADIHALDDLRYIPSWSLDEYGVRMADIERRMRELGLEVDDD